MEEIMEEAHEISEKLKREFPIMSAENCIVLACHNIQIRQNKEILDKLDQLLNQSNK